MVKLTVLGPVVSYPGTGYSSMFSKLCCNKIVFQMIMDRNQIGRLMFPSAQFLASCPARERETFVLKLFSFCPLVKNVGLLK